jgi:hypothetical protein
VSLSVKSTLVFLLGAVVGGFIQLVLAIVFEPTFRRIYRRSRGKLAFIVTALRTREGWVDNEIYNVGGSRVPCVILEGSPSEAVRPGNLTAVLAEQPLVLPDDLASLVSSLRRRQEQIAAVRGQPTYFNGPMVALEGWSRGRTRELEDTVLALRFVPTDYYTFLATAMSLNELIDLDSGPATVRDVYVSGRDYRNPNPVIATSFGINIALVTSDHFLILVRRGTSVSNYAGRVAVPIGESVHPVLDGVGGRHLDLFNTAIRGAREELNLEVSQADINLYSLHIDTNWYFYCLSGAIFSSQFSRDDVIAHRSTGSKDKWESADVIPIRFDPLSVARYVRDEGGPQQFAPSSFVCATQALMAFYGEKDVVKAFKRNQ